MYKTAVAGVFSELETSRGCRERVNKHELWLSYYRYVNNIFLVGSLLVEETKTTIISKVTFLRKIAISCTVSPLKATD